MARKSNLAARIDQADGTLSNDSSPVVRVVNTEQGSRVTALRVHKEIAKSNICIRNYSYTGGLENFPYEADLRTVDMYLPLAEGGPLLVDEPMYSDGEARCARKAKVMAKFGYRYLVITPKTEMHDAMMELASQKDRKGRP